MPKKADPPPTIPLFDLPRPEPDRRAIRMKEGWRPDPLQMAKLRADFPTVPIDEELEKFEDFHLAKGSKFVDWYRATRTWMRNARDFANKQRRTAPERGLPAGKYGGYTGTKQPTYNPAEDQEPW